MDARRGVLGLLKRFLPGGPLEEALLSCWEEAGGCIREENQPQDEATALNRGAERWKKPEC